jgi:hypothetical protein
LSCRVARCAVGWLCSFTGGHGVPEKTGYIADENTRNLQTEILSCK